MAALAEPRHRPLLGVLGAVAVAVLTVSGCSAGQDAQTVEQTSVVDGTAFEAGAIALRDVGLRAPSGTSYAAGDTAFLEGLVVNQNSQPDQLLSVSSPIADSVEIYSDGVSALLGLQAESASASPSASATGSATGSASASGSESPSDTAAPSATASASASASATGSASGSSTASASPSTSANGPVPLTQLDLPTNQSIQFGYTNQQVAIVFVGLKQQLFPAQKFQITMTFAKAGAVTASIAVKLPVDSTIDAPTVNTEEEEGGGE